MSPVSTSKVDEYRFTLDGRIPVWKLHVEPRPRAAVILLHGLSSTPEEQRAELVSLAEHGLTAVGFEVLHHGSRRDGWLEKMASARPPASHVLLLELVRASVPEVVRVLEHLRAEGHGPIGMAGVSMGAYIALAAATEEPRIQACASILGSPDWTPRSGPLTPEIARLLPASPAARPAECARHPLLLINATLDEHVPAAFSRTFADKLARVEPALAQHVRSVEYPQSGHFMRPEDWHHAWAAVLGFFQHELRG